MRRTPTAACLAVLLVAVALAGCAEDASPAPAAPSTPETILVTEANDVASLANESFMMAAHQHDYWQGKDRLVILDVTQETEGTWFGEYLPFVFVPEDGVVVPQGTARVEITISWVDGEQSFYSSPEVAVKTAADHETHAVGPVSSGDTVTVETGAEHADLPHQGISAWAFEWRLYAGLLPTDAVPGIHWAGEITVHVEAVRGLEIPVYPPHPDLWGGAETILLFEDSPGFGVWFGDVDRWSCFLECPWRHRPANGTVVPFDTAAVEIVFEPGADNPTQIGVKFHGADTRAWQDLEPASVEGKKQTFVIPVEPGMGDSPYASQSVWEVAIYVAGPQRDSVEIGSYTMSARALK